MTDLVLELADASVVKNGVRVLDGLTLSIPAGAHTAILGANGAGKSTLINLLTHDDRPLAGDGVARVRVLGHDRWNVAELRARLGVVSADLHHRFVNGNSAGRIRALEAVLSGFFSAYGVVPSGGVDEARRAGALAALARMGIAHLAATPVNEMSTGEARRVLIARALVTEPAVLVLDEPTSGLDLVARHRFLESVRGVARQGTTLVLVTHRVEEIVPEIARVVLLRRGRILADGPKADVLTATGLSAAFDAPVSLERSDAGYFHARVAPR